MQRPDALVRGQGLGRRGRAGKHLQHRVRDAGACSSSPAATAIAVARSEGFQSTALPATSAGSHFHAGVTSGTFHGRDRRHHADRAPHHARSGRSLPGRRVIRVVAGRARRPCDLALRVGAALADLAHEQLAEPAGSASTAAANACSAAARSATGSAAHAGCAAAARPTAARDGRRIRDRGREEALAQERVPDDDVAHAVSSYVRSGERRGRPARPCARPRRSRSRPNASSMPSRSVTWVTTSATENWPDAVSSAIDVEQRGRVARPVVAAADALLGEQLQRGQGDLDPGRRDADD